MKTPNRDLLVLVKEEFDDHLHMEQELDRLNRLLFHFETLDTICVAHEVFDVNKGKVIELPLKVREILNNKKLKPFQFAFNKN